MTWQQLLQLSEAELGGIDPVLVHLACAVGLPGAEKLDIAACQRKVDDMAKRVQHRTRQLQNHFERDPDAFNRSKPVFRAAAMVEVLQRDLGVRYDSAFMQAPGAVTENDPLFKDARNLFIHGILEG